MKGVLLRGVGWALVWLLSWCVFNLIHLASFGMWAPGSMYWPFLGGCVAVRLFSGIGQALYAERWFWE